jgi:hypothetical protein
MDSRKRAVSIRMNAADIRDVKKVANRLGARDSDVIRFAVKVMLGRLAPLHDSHLRGHRLVPMFVEFGPDIFRYFDLDAVRLESIINEGTDDASRVEYDDVHLIAMSGIQQSYAKLRLSSMGNGKAGAVRPDSFVDDSEELGNSLRRYLYDKYVYRNPEGQRTPADLESSR